MTASTLGLNRPYPIELLENVGVATVLKTVTPERSGRVRFESADWPARVYYPNLQQPLKPDTVVHVVGRQGITLLVVPKLASPCR